MEWVESLKVAVDYMEKNLLENIVADDVADAVYMSPFYFHRGFKLMTRYSIAEYIRYRRLYMYRTYARIPSIVCFILKTAYFPPRI